MRASSQLLVVQIQLPRVLVFPDFLLVVGASLDLVCLFYQSISGYQSFGYFPGLNCLQRDFPCNRNTTTPCLHLMISSPNLISAWFCLVTCNMPLKDSTVLMYFPGLGGTGIGLVVHEKALGK
ncbi:unnamed protein product [Lactuca saligna]|uniref:Uncharacterized protein n=1 Tax=Lactuca saligna TaxID=75948 RepID=A0AA36EI02_LACSI|nr:unnamed protein product [Lactuca saligna]